MNTQLSQDKIIFLTALFVVFVDNGNFFRHVTKVYPLNLQNSGFLVSIIVIFCCFLVILFSLFSSKYTMKPFLIFSILTAAVIAYFTNTYHIIIDDTMIQNIFETNVSESADLISPKLFLYLTLLGLIPAWLISRVKLQPAPLKRTLTTTLIRIVLSLIIIVICLFSFSDFYTSFFREHKPLRYYTNPTYAFYSVGKFIGNKINSGKEPFKQIGLDAKKATGAQGRKLTIVVVGEAARADHFSLNGYSRETNPLLKKEDIINFPNLYSCGTTTATSVPCMFSLLDRDNYSDKKAKSTENVLDVLKHGGVKVLWRDNNSSSKGVADRVDYQSYRNSKTNPICDGECRDEGMLIDLQDYIDNQKEGDVLIVLHQMGNHGPAYFRRYPQNFEQFTPVCKTNQFEECQPEEIINAYDNSLRYTDYFLSRTIALLKQNDGDFQTSLIYMSDHGESLGGNGLYLHGLPYFMAPDAQKHVGALMWFGKKAKESIDTEKLKQVANHPFSQDNLFHTLLGLMQIETSVYQPDADILASFTGK